MTKNNGSSRAAVGWFTKNNTEKFQPDDITTGARARRALQERAFTYLVIASTD